MCGNFLLFLSHIYPPYYDTINPMSSACRFFCGGGIFCSCIKMPENPGDFKTDVTYRFEGGADLTSLFALEAVYTTAEGTLQSEPIEALPWVRSVRTGLPFDARLDVRFAASAEYPEKMLYDVGFDGSVTWPGDVKKQASAAFRTGANQCLELRCTLPDGVSPDDVSFVTAPLKYDKHFAFTFTVDDSSVNAYSRVWSLIQGKWIDNTEFWHLGAAHTTGRQPEHPLTMGDGCGGERRFGFSCGIWPTFGNDWNKTFVKDAADTGVNSMYISWEELQLIVDFGSSVCFHNVDQRRWGKSDPDSIARGFQADYDRTLEKLGVEMKVLALPDGNSAYARAAQQSPLVGFIRSSLKSGNRIRLRTCGDITKQETYGGDNTSVAADKLAELAREAASPDPYWVGLTVHRPQEDYIQMLETICELYGKDGADNLWVASWDEIYEYVTLREGLRIEKRTEGRDVVFTVTLPETSGFLFNELSFLLSGVGAACQVMPESGAIVGLDTRFDGKRHLLNVRYGNRFEALAEKYTLRYEQTPDEEARADASYFVSLLLPALASPFEERIAAAESLKPGKNQVTRAGAEQYRTKYDGYEFTVRRKIAAGSE